MSLPKELRERARAPHRLAIWTREAAFPDAAALARFCGLEAAAGGEGWFRAASGPVVVLVLRPDEAPEGPEGYAHVLEVESGSARPCFLAAYHAARSLGGVVWIQKRFEAYAPARFGELYLADVDLEARWTG